MSEYLPGPTLALMYGASRWIHFWAPFFDTWGGDQEHPLERFCRQGSAEAMRTEASKRPTASCEFDGSTKPTGFEFPGGNWAEKKDFKEEKCGDNLFKSTKRRAKRLPRFRVFPTAFASKLPCFPCSMHLFLGGGGEAYCRRIKTS